MSTFGSPSSWLTVQYGWLLSAPIGGEQLWEGVMPTGASDAGNMAVSAVRAPVLELPMQAAKERSMWVWASDDPRETLLLWQTPLWFWEE